MFASTASVLETTITEISYARCTAYFMKRNNSTTAATRQRRKTEFSSNSGANQRNQHQERDRLDLDVMLSLTCSNDQHQPSICAEAELVGIERPPQLSLTTNKPQWYQNDQISMILGDTSASLAMTKAPAETTGSKPLISCCSGTSISNSSHSMGYNVMEYFKDSLCINNI